MFPDTPWQDRVMLAVATLAVPTFWLIVCGGGLLAFLHYIIHTKIWTPAVVLVLAALYAWLIISWLISLERQSLVNSLSSVQNMPAYNDLWKKRDEAYTQINQALGTWSFVRLMLWVLPILIAIGSGLVVLLLGVLRWVNVPGVDAWLWPIGVGLAVADPFLYRTYKRTRRETMGW